jgi:hypothetical protein
MKRNALQIFLGFAVALCILACNNKKDDHKSATGEDEKAWKEMDDFHMVMAETFHPYKDSANLAPAKAKADDLVASADKWTSTGLPERVDNEEMKSMLQQLKSEAEVLRDVVQSGSDEQIGAALTKLHDTFHAVQELWYGGHGHEQHEHAHH